MERLVIDNIKQIRKAKGISQEKLAEACNTATSYIGLMEIYRNVPKLSTIERIAGALDVDPLVFFKKTYRLPEEQEIMLSDLKCDILSCFEKDLDAVLRKYLNSIEIE
ncbi:helix-turn-helix domain-containing protein [Breznakiella homolactica]|uniref:Helix-turn-helix transcriptional regulator n=1 Tax=Breznakiella homolactica TaxID=2798577 RepID=A0A7T7XQZ3_9SPIR|nr:helix-turn-helix transcriptional regulator [Breznakiella homolactica]QQO10839.1 helix-turn-helix domain-containing protein [Breznakiella homolactica]